MSLFAQNHCTYPLAYRMSPQSLDEYVGQRHILGKGKLLQRLIEADRLSSLILYGPPGVGKTALAKVIANQTNAHFIWLNAVTANLEDIRKASKQAEYNRTAGTKTVLFVDEIHRFNKLQQDALLPDVEKGTLILISATVENPFFYINKALISRSHIFELKPLAEEEIIEILRRAITDSKKGLGHLKIHIDDDALRHLAKQSDGDARKALNSLELAVMTTEANAEGVIQIDLSVAEQSIEKKAVVYDKDGDEHYDTISAFIKSMRGSDPEATTYYLAKMLYAGEDPRFIARRIVICASEDVGNADPLALVVAVSALKAVEFVGMPEARIILSQSALYVANAPKSNACYTAIDNALEQIKKEMTLPIPNHLKDSHYKGAKTLGHGKGYKYPHSYGGYVKQDYLSKKPDSTS